MAIPTMAMNNLLEVGDCLEDTDAIMYGALCTQRMMLAAVRRQKARLTELRARLLADVQDGPTLPHATQLERLRRMQHIATCLGWIEQTEETINNVIQVLRSPPQRPGPTTEEEEMTMERA